MLIDPRTVRRIAREISIAADGVHEAYQGGLVSEEVKITSQLLGAIRERLRNKSINGVKWSAYELRGSRGVSAEERRHGADLLGVLDIAIEDFEVKKGFLAQAKKAEPGTDLKDWDRLVEQSEVMLDRTPDAFILVYSQQRGIRVFPANAVVGSGSKDIFDLYDRSLGRFFEEHIQCFIGDHNLNSPSVETLDVLADMPIRRVLKLEARAEGK